MNATSATPTPHWKTGLLLFLAVLALSLPQAALLPLLDRDEPRFSEASREMIQSGNFIVPTFNNQPRYNKPPLIYWCQTLSYTLFGENALAARLPSILATAGTALLLFAWGVQLGSRCIGMIAALAYAFCLQTMQQGRVATADALLIFFMTLTAFAGWKLITISHASRSSRSYFWDTILTLGFAGGFLAKGPEAFLPFLSFLFCARGIRRGLLMEGAVNFFLGAALVLFWAIPAYIQSRGDYVSVGLKEGIFDRIFSGLQGHGASGLGWYLLGALFYYPLFFCLFALPTWPLVAIHRKKLFDGWKPDPLDTYLLLNAGIIFLVFTLMVTKLPHYILPAFPFLALFFARRWIAADFSPGLPTQLSGGLGLVFALLTFVLVPVALAHHASPSPTGELVRMAQADGALTPDTQFEIVDFKEPNTVWEMRRVVRGYCESEGIPQREVLAFLNRPGPHAVLLSTPLWEEIETTSDNNAPRWKIYQASGWNTAKGIDFNKGTFATIDLTLVVKK